MKKRIFIFLIILLAVFVQTSILPLCFSNGNIPNFVLVLAVSGVAAFGFQLTWIWVIISGFILDIFSFGAVGINVFSFMFFSYAVSFFSRRLILGEKSGGILVGAVFISLMTVFNSLWIFLASTGFKFQEIWKINNILGAGIFWKIILNLILFFIFISIFKKIKKRLAPSNNLII